MVTNSALLSFSVSITVFTKGKISMFAMFVLPEKLRGVYVFRFKRSNKTGLTFTSDKDRGGMTPPVDNTKKSFAKHCDDSLNSFKDS